MNKTTKTLDFLVTPATAVTWLAKAHESLKGPFKDRDFVRLRRETPDKPQIGGLPVRVPVWHGITVQDTFKLQVKLLQYQYGDKFWRWPHLESDENRLRLLGGNKQHPGQCLRWEVIDLDPVPERNQKPSDVRHPDKSPHAGVLAFVTQNRTYGLGMNGKNKPYLWAPGYEVTISGSGPSWRRVPRLYLSVPVGQVRLFAGRCGRAVGAWSVPCFL